MHVLLLHLISPPRRQFAMAMVCEEAIEEIEKVKVIEGPEGSMHCSSTSKIWRLHTLIARFIVMQIEVMT